jgi:glycosyltransferase involved in cell wall biosynthesis
MRIGIVTSHPVPYHVPVYRGLARQPDVDLEVLFSHDHGVKPTFDRGFGREVMFDVPLLDGYRYRFPRNYARTPGFTFTGQINPEIPLAVARGDYDAVIVHGYQTLTSVATLLAPRVPRRTRILMRSETTLLNVRPLATRAAKQLLMRMLFQGVDHFLAIGTCSRKYYEAYGVDSSKITVAPYTVDNSFFEERSANARRDPSAARARLGLPTDRTVYLYCSKVAPHKRPLDVLHAFDIAQKTAPCALAYVGVGSATAELEEHVHRLGLTKDVFLLGFRNQSELPEIYGACDVFVQASEFEPWGMVVNEAMASGMAVCLSDAVGSGYDLVRGNGATFPVGDVNRLAELFVEWALNPTKITEMKRASLARIREWGVEQSVAGVIAGVRKALAS